MTSSDLATLDPSHRLMSTTRVARPSPVTHPIGEMICSDYSRDSLIANNSAIFHLFNWSIVIL